MKNTNMHRHSSKLIALAGLLAGAVTLPVSAQSLVNTSVNAVGGAAGGIGHGFGSSAGGAASSGAGVGGMNGSGSAGASGAVGGAPLTRDVRASGAFETIGMRQERVATQTDVAQRHVATTALNSGPSSLAIHAASRTEREQLATDIDERVAASSKAMAAMKTQSKSLNGDARAEFKSAAKDVDAREKELHASLKAARDASDETWVDRRASVAASYEAYTQSVGRAEAIAASGQSSATGKATLKP
jgi:hypothetical protein